MTSGAEPVVSPKSNSSHFLRWATLFAFALSAYWPSLNVPFVFDDLPNLVVNPAVRIDGPFDLATVWEHSLRDGRRIVAMVTFAWNHWWGAYDPTGYHLVNIAIHVANGVLLYSLVHRLAHAPRSPASLARVAAVFAFAVALLWLVHPVNTQAVTYIVQRMTSLAALFYLGCIWLFVVWRSGRMRGWLAWPTIALGFVMALLTKEHTATLPAALLLIDAAFFSGWRRYHLWGAIALLAAAIVGASLAIGWPFPALWDGGGSGGREFTRLERVLTQGRVIWHYLSLIAWPEHGRLQLDYDMAISHGFFEPLTTFWAWAGIITASLGAFIALPRFPWPAAGWLFFIGALSVESSVIMLEMVFEHRIYLPLTLLVAGLLAPFFGIAASQGREGLLSIAAIAAAGVLTFQTIERNREWTDIGDFWAQDLQRGASPYRSALNGAWALARQGRPNEALTLLDSIPDRERKPRERFKMAQARGEILAMQGRWEDALTAFSRALKLQPLSTRAAYAAGHALIQLDRIDDAQAMLAQLERQFPDNGFTKLLSARLAVAEGDPEQGLVALSDWLEAYPYPEDSLVNVVRLHRASLLVRLDRHEEAIEAYRTIVERYPGYWQAWANLAQLLRAQGRDEEAARVQRRLRANGIALDAASWSASAPVSGGVPRPGANTR